MSRFSPEERERIMAESDQHLAEANTRSPYELVADVIEDTPWEWESQAERHARLINHGVRLSVAPDALERWRADEEVRRLEREAYQKHEAHEQREAEIRRQQQAAAREAEPFTELQVDVIGAVIAEERKRGREERKAEHDELRSEFATALGAALAKGDQTVAQLRQEIAKQRGVDDGDVVDLAAPGVVRKVKDSSNAA